MREPECKLRRYIPIPFMHGSVILNEVVEPDVELDPVGELGAARGGLGAVDRGGGGQRMSERYKKM